MIFRSRDLSRDLASEQNRERLSQIAATYTAAADTLDALPFWHHFGRRTVERLALGRGARVLDFCCGTGASAIPAADAVGPSGRVLGVDVTEALVHQARDKVLARGLSHASFTCATVESLSFPPASFDAIISVFGLFFVADMSVFPTSLGAPPQITTAALADRTAHHILARGSELAG